MQTPHSPISLIFLFSCISHVFSLPQNHLRKQCLDDQRSSLLQLQQHLYHGPNFTFSSKFELWDLDTDCCSWEGVTCDALGHVIGLNLSNQNFSGTFHSIFDLRHLNRLNLAGNNFNSTLLSYEFDKLPNLTHLNLSSSCFHGQIPTEMANLTRLVSLDLSHQDDCYWRNHYSGYDFAALKLEKPNFQTLIKNLKLLTELYLDGVDIFTHSSNWCETTSLVLTGLQVLSLSNCGLEGPLCPSLSTLPFLSKLVLDYNSISSLPPNFLESSSRLVSLSLASCYLSGDFPTGILLLPKIQSIDLSYNQFMGQLPEFPSNSTLQSLSLSEINFSGKLTESIGNLKLLRDLTLKGCNFFGSIPSSIANLSHLVNLDLSENHFSGHFPTKILSLPKIQSIDISGNEKLMGQLQEFSSNSALRSLSLSHTNFSGALSESIGNLKFLRDLTLLRCNFSGSIPSSIGNLSYLVNLDLSQNNFSGKLPESIGNLKFLRNLNLGVCNFSGSIPWSIANLSHLVNLDLSYNQFSGPTPSSLFTLPSLRELSLRWNQLVGGIDEFPNASSSLIEGLYLGNNYFSGALPESILQLPRLQQLSIGDNGFSSLKLLSFVQLKNLRGLDLSNMSLLIESDNKSLTFPQLDTLYLRSCNLIEFPEFIKTQDKLSVLDLSNNHIHGVVPNWLWKSSLRWVDLSFNPIGFQKQLPLDDADFSFPMLGGLILTSCNISAFPEFLRSQEDLEELDLSNNRISGAIPNWAWKKSLVSLNLSNNHLSSLDLLLSNLSLTSSEASLSSPICNLSQLYTFDASHNNLSGSIPYCFGNLGALELLDLHGNNFSGIMPDFSKATQLWFLKVSENSLEEKLPTSLAECTQLVVLDVGNNMINDTFPFWLEKLPYLAVLILRENRFYGQIKYFKNISVFPTLDVLDITSNKFSGELSIDFLNVTQLRSLKIGGNKLEGKLPTSLVNCSKLEVLDIGNNMVHDIFPFWLEKLPSLKVLILRANRFYGTITTFDVDSVFPKLRILDIASNNFSGDLSIEFLQSLKAMAMITNGDKAKLDYIGEVYYQDSVTIVNKGVELFYQKVLTTLTCLDLSNNNFHERIPEEIEVLKSLKVLNLSHNSFIGEIPSALDNLKDLESLDLSQNKLSGKIPPQLASLTFLAALNLSYNQLEGSIPQSNQFITFTNDSYRGNSKLCGPPFSRKCNEVGLPMPPPAGEDEKDSWLDAMSTWQIALVGYASGLVVGLCIGYTVLNELGNKWVDKFRMYGKGNRRRRRRTM